jgi:uncharacterized protein (TIGR02996 family)
MLDGEHEWLAAVVANLADDNTKLVYADWLDEHGDAARAKFLRQFVAASRTMTMEPEFPKPKAKYGEEWLELIGFRLLHGLAMEGRAGFKRAYLKYARPALRMVKKPAKDTKLTLGASKVGGKPDLPKDFAWPKGKECKAIYNDPTTGVEQLAGFLAQVNFAEIAHTQAAKDLPKKGLLSFFCFQDIENDNPDVIGAKAVFFPDATALVRTKPPGELVEGNTEMPVQRLTFEETLDLPESSGPWVDDLSSDDDEDGEWHDVWVYGDYRNANFYNMFGYSRSTSGGDPTPDKKHRHLIVLQNAGECTLHIQIHQKDLTALNFDKIKLVWVDFD